MICLTWDYQELMWYKKKPKKNIEDLPLFKGQKIAKRIDYKAKLDKVFSMYIRLRDSKRYGYKYFKCISCGKILPFEKADAGHYMSRRHNATRFDEDNVHAECSYDNRFNAEHLDGFRENLIRKIGQQRFDLLRAKANTSKSFSDFELKELIKYYSALVKKMQSEM
jgi:hypothetical protein